MPLLHPKHYPLTRLDSLQEAQPCGLWYVLLNPCPFLQFYQCLNPAVIISCLDYCHDLLTELSASYLDLLHSILYIFVKVNFLKWKLNHVTPLLGNIPSLSPTYVINNKFLIWPLPSLGELLSTILQPELFTSAIPDDFDPLVASFTLLGMPFPTSLSGLPLPYLSSSIIASGHLSWWANLISPRACLANRVLSIMVDLKTEGKLTLLGGGKKTNNMT